MVQDYEYAWGDDPCDITTEIVEKLDVKNISQVVGSLDHLLSFCTIPSIKKVIAFDIDERALAFAELKISTIKNLDFNHMCRFFNMSKYRKFIGGEHNHPLLD